MSTSAPSNGTFYAVLSLVVGGMGVGILVLSLLVLTSGPRVRHVVVHNPDGYNGVASVEQGLTLIFDRPVQSASGGTLREAISLRPEADYTVSHRQGQVNVTFERNLRSDTEYVLSVSPTVRDSGGRRMDEGYSYEFATAEPTFTYLERNHGPGAMDRIIERAPFSDKAQTVFEAAQIGHFARNQDYLAVVLPRTEFTDELWVVNAESGESETVDVPGAVRIESLDFSSVGDRFVFVTRVVAGPAADESFRRGYDGRLYRFDVDNRRLQTVGGSSDKARVEGALYSSDGQAMLYRTLDGAYFLTDASGTAGTIPLGGYVATGGFNRINTKLVFENDDGVVTYDARTRRARPLPRLGEGWSTTTPTFLNNSDSLIFLESLPDPASGEPVTQVAVADATGESVQGLVRSRPPAYFFDPPATSDDDRYVLVETALLSDEIDSYPANPQPENARIKLYDRSKREWVDQVRGVDPVWSR